jgi:hypothetical protein
MKAARASGRGDDLADALRALADGLPGEQHSEPEATPGGVSRALGGSPEPARPIDTAAIYAAIAAEDVRRGGVEAAKASPPRSLQDVVRDITPDADDAVVSPDRTDRGHGDDDGPDPPAEEPIALVDDVAPARDAQVAPEPYWELGTVSHLHQLTQCGRIDISDLGELNFDGRVLKEPGLVLKVGLAVDCRVVERPDGGVRILEMAAPETP